MLQTIARIPRLARVILLLLVMLPIIWLVVARDTGEALRLWGLVAAMSIVPGLVIDRLYPRDTAGNVYDSAHPAHGRAIAIELATALVTGVAYFALLALLE